MNLAPGYNSSNDGARWHVFRYAGSSENRCSITDDDMLHCANLTADYAPLAHARPPRETRLRGYYGILAEIAVVPDLDQIIELDASSQDSIAESAAIDRAVCSDFAIIFDEHSAKL
jgi:hypothetical protein